MITGLSARHDALISGLTSCGPYTTASALVLPCSRYADPSACANTLMRACSLRSSGAFRPSSRYPWSDSSSSPAIEHRSFSQHASACTAFSLTVERKPAFKGAAATYCTGVCDIRGLLKKQPIYNISLFLHPFLPFPLYFLSFFDL